jgi:hypothetical protein
MWKTSEYVLKINWKLHKILYIFIDKEAALLRFRSNALKSTGKNNCDALYLDNSAGNGNGIFYNISMMIAEILISFVNYKLISLLQLYVMNIFYFIIHRNH